MPEQTYTKLFMPIKGLALSGTTLVIQVPSQYFVEQVEENWLEQLGIAVRKELGEDADLEYNVVVDMGAKGTGPLGYNMPAQHRTGKPAYPGQNGVDPFRQSNAYVGHHGNLSSQYSFENFVVADCNQLAVAAGQRICQAPGISGFNPLLIHGGVGIGKTHLIQAIGNRFKALYPNKVVIYVTLEQFFNQYVEAVRNNSTNDLSNFYMSVDMLIVDDIHFLAKKEATQEIFFNIFNRLHQNQKQIILTSDVPPRDLQDIKERLLSRFKWGVTADMHLPTFETRLAILHKKLENDGVSIPEDVLEYLASTIDTSVRELTGVLLSLIARGTLHTSEIDLNMARQVIQSVVDDVNDTPLNIETITKLVSEYYHISEDQLKEKTRKREIVIPRQVAMYLTKELTKSSLQIIGDFFGGKDHTTVLHAIRNVQKQMADNDDIRLAIDTLQRKLGGSH